MMTNRDSAVRIILDASLLALRSTAPAVHKICLGACLLNPEAKIKLSGAGPEPVLSEAEECPPVPRTGRAARATETRGPGNVQRTKNPQAGPLPLAHAAGIGRGLPSLHR